MTAERHLAIEVARRSARPRCDHTAGCAEESNNKPARQAEGRGDERFSITEHVHVGRVPAPEALASRRQGFVPQPCRRARRAIVLGLSRVPQSYKTSIDGRFASQRSWPHHRVRRWAEEAAGGRLIDSREHGHGPQRPAAHEVPRGELEGRSAAGSAASAGRAARAGRGSIGSSRGG